MKSLLDKVNAKLNAQGGFLKAISVLVGGTAFAQILGVITLPVITRLYSPSEFGLFAMYTSIIMVLTVIGCLRYEIAIPIPKENNAALALVKISILILMSFVLIVLSCVGFLCFFEGGQYFKQWYWLIPLSVLLVCVFNVFQYWYIRQRDFKYIANTKIQQSSIVAFSQILAGIFHISGGLIVGALLGAIYGFTKSLNKFSKQRNSIFKISAKKEAVEYRKFPMFSTFEALFNTGAVYLPLILMGIYLDKEDLALVFLAIKVLALPISLVGSAISQVYLSQAAEIARKAKLKSFTNSIVKKLAFFMLIPFLLIMLFMPYLSGWVFGEKWEGIGDFIVLMLPWFYFQLISSPVSYALQVTGNQKAALILQIFGFIIRFFGVYLLCIFSLTDKVIIYYALSGFVFYLIYFWVIQIFIKKSDALVGGGGASGK